MTKLATAATTSAVCLIFATVACLWASNSSFLSGYQHGFDSGIDAAKKNIWYLATKPWKKKGDKWKMKGIPNETERRDGISDQGSVRGVRPGEARQAGAELTQEGLRGGEPLAGG